MTANSLISAPASGSGKTTIARGLMALLVKQGMMGVFDGYDSEKGSSVEMASVLEVPVVLVVDAKDNPVSYPVLKYKNVLECCTHLYNIGCNGQW